MSENFSYSKLDTYVQCPFKYYLRYVEGHYVGSASIATEIGTMIHETEEAIANCIINKEEINYIALKNSIIAKLFILSEKYKVDFNEVDKSNRTYREKIYYYLEDGIYKLEQFMSTHPTYSIVGVEKSFLVEYKGKKFKGFIDRVFYDSAANKYIIQDIKTYAVEVEKDKLATPLQFVIYTLAAKELFNCVSEQVECQYYLPFCDLTQNAGTAGYMNRGTTKLDKIFESIENKNFEPHATPLCNWCEFCRTNPNAPTDGKNLCPYHCLWHRDTRNKFDIKNVANDWQGLENHAAIMESYSKTIEEEVR